MLCHHRDVVLLVLVLPRFVKVDQFLVQRLVEQLEIHQTSLGIAVCFLNESYQKTDVVQHILDVIVAKRLPRAVLEDSVLYVRRILARLVSILLMSLPLPVVLADLQEIDLLPEKIAITAPFVFRKIAHLLHVRHVEIASVHVYRVPRCFLQKY